MPGVVNVATGGQQTPVASPVSTNRQGNQVKQGADSSGNAFPIVPLCIGLGSLILLGFLLLKGWRLLRGPAQPRRSPTLPLAGSVSGSRQRKRRQDSFVGQRAFDLSTSWSGVLTRNELEQATQQPRVVDSIPSLHPQSGAANIVSYAGETASVSFYGSPGVPQPGAFYAPGGNQPTVAHIPVLPATPAVPGTQVLSSNGPATDSLGLSDSSVQATVQSYVY